MRSARGKRKRAWRWLLISLASMLCAFLLVVNALDFFPQESNLSTVSLVRFGFSALTALIYLAVGSLVWLFARQRGVASLLFCFSLAMMITFANETAGDTRSVLLATVVGISSVVALALFAILLLMFPYDYLGALRTRRRGKRRASVCCGRVFLWAYITGNIIFASLISAYALVKHILLYQTPSWLDTTVNLYYAAALACILLTIIGAYILSHELRTRQQLLLFVIGVVLACAPVFFLTVLPQALDLPNRYFVDGQWSSLPLLLLPLALGYSVLRYQILVFDLYIRRAVAWTAGVVGLAVLCYLVVALSGQIFDEAHLRLVHIITVTTAMALLGPLTWWLARLTTEQLFFPEFRYYRLHMQRPELLTRETFDLNKA
ncbi:MAG TPA: hypothetical protein VN729_01695, partial [Ktedonobacteraceae bacterium]|nr:hypothetical protein [Ktedonobacteraceae bacterium]